MNSGEKNGAAYAAECGCGRHDLYDPILKRVRQELPTDELLADLADLYRIFADSTRVKILFSLFESEMCVCAIAELLQMTQSAISHQLKVLKDANLVANRRAGKTVYYFLADDHVRSIILQGFEHLLERRDSTGGEVQP
ncbi:MAG: metalloregulator ArsR/SmtB family transcription factor [Oscillospiraceae bacterium]|nr:metalloregulator ArsR/SmtB family transcription factor [Oscillospiraceae bacterium]